MSRNPNVEDVIEPQIFLHKFNFGTIFLGNPILCLFLLWPDRSIERLILRYSAKQATFSIPLPLSLLSQNKLLELSENLSGRENKVNFLRIENNIINIGIKDHMISYKILDPPPNRTLEGEAAAVYILTIKKYLWAYSDFIRKGEINPQELNEFLEVHPSAKNFSFVKEIATEFFQNNQMPKLGKGKRSNETKERIRIKNYALYNLIRSFEDGENGIEQTFLSIGKFIEEDRGLDEDYYSTIKRAYYRAKREVESTESGIFANFRFFTPLNENQNSTSNIYISIIYPLSFQTS